MSYDTDDFGMLSQKKVISIIKEVFGAEHPRHTDNKKQLIFNTNKLDRLDSVTIWSSKLKMAEVLKKIMLVLISICRRLLLLLPLSMAAALVLLILMR
jgi:hypothetical protein